MWILQWLPNWIFYAIFFAGLLGLVATFVMKFIPLVYVYRTPIQAVSVVLIAIGTYMAGAISNEEAFENIFRIETTFAVFQLPIF